MTVCGIIAEFNPFHNGHAYLFSEARRITNADYLIIMMSGDYVQRGEPACMDKYSRTKAALSAGADAVFELPVCIATGSAQYFARGAVAALNALGVVDYLCFGSESGDIEELYQKTRLTESESGYASRDLPNNILAVEYLKALDYFHSPIKPVTVKRHGNDYNDITIKEGEFCSAAAVRNLLESQSENFADINNYSSNTGKDISGNPSGTLSVSLHDDVSNLLTGLIPNYAIQIMQNYYKTHHYLTFDSLSDLLFYKLMLEQNQDKNFSDYFDIYDDLANKIRTAFSGIRPTSASAFRNILKSKDIALSHISRALLHIVLEISKTDVELMQQYNYCAYLRPLGYHRDADTLRKSIKEQADRPILSKLADASKSLNEEQLTMLKKDISASDLYQQISVTPKMTAMIPGEYRQPILFFENKP